MEDEELPAASGSTPKAIGTASLQRGLFASKESTRPEWSRSSESGRPVDPNPKDEWFLPDVRG